MADVFIGIDPGVGGAIGHIWGNDPKAIVLDMPVYRILNQRRDYNLDHILKILTAIVGKHSVLAAIERPGPAQGKGKLAIASLARCGGIFDMAFTSLRVPHLLVSPSEWKRDMGLARKEKDASVALAVRLFPQMTSMLERVKDHGRAEALLLAEWCRRQS